MRSARAVATSLSSSAIWVASSRVGASTRAAGRGPSLGVRSTIGMPKASVLPEPVGDLTSTSRPARTSAITALLDGERLVDPAAPQRVADSGGHAEIGERLMGHEDLLLERR